MLAGIFDLKKEDNLKLGIQENLVFALSSGDPIRCGLWEGACVDRFCPKGISFLTTVTLVLS